MEDHLVPELETDFTWSRTAVPNQGNPDPDPVHRVTVL